MELRVRLGQRWRRLREVPHAGLPADGRRVLGIINPYSGRGGGCGGGDCREVPDVAADAAPETGYVVFSNGAWTVTGGTSASSPFWAGLVALADASSTCCGLSLGFVNPALYQIAGSAYRSDFFDVSGASQVSGRAGDQRLTYTPTMKNGVRWLTFTPATRAVSLRLAGPAITISRREAAKIRRHKATRLSLRLWITDVSGQMVTLAVTVKKLS